MSKKMKEILAGSQFYSNFVPNKSDSSMEEHLILKPSMADTSRLQPFVDEAAEAAGIL